ncbi:hypothetical protein Pen01_01040 [Phytomonospora endophytica]|nr:hypothetical protein Pen01_01040 [Phytomonospora endophytica]
MSVAQGWGGGGGGRVPRVSPAGSADHFGEGPGRGRRGAPGSGRAWRLPGLVSVEVRGMAVIHNRPVVHKLSAKVFSARAWNVLDWFRDGLPPVGVGYHHPPVRCASRLSRRASRPGRAQPANLSLR